MRSWGKMCAAVLVLTAVIFVAANMLLHHLKTSEQGRPYRVEISRLALQIEQDGLEGLDLSQCKYVYHVAVYGENFYDSGSDYSIREINDTLYRFDYAVGDIDNHTSIVFAVNISLAVMAAAVIGILFYVRANILQPFERLTNVPYELSRGNLTVPVQENKRRFFGKFLWGMEMLRESIEQQRQRELELQKEKKTLLLSLSHDLKTPLSTIKLYAKALSRTLYSDPQKQKEIADKIHQKADEIEGYVSQIITASREDFLSLDVENGEFYLSDLICRITDYYEEKLALVKTEFIVGEYKNRLLSGDLDRSVEVMQNIIENSLKYGDGKYVELLFPEEEEGVFDCGKK